MINTIILGHALNELPKLPAESINCVTCSPPYWGLRDYGIEPVIWDGDKDCKHDFSIETKAGDIRFRGKNSIVGSERNPKVWEGDGKGQFCNKCSAWCGSLGLEPTFELYIKHLCNIFDEIKRVLRKDGTCWVNLGDTYSGSGCGTNDYRTEASKSIQGKGKNKDLYKTGGIAQRIKNIPAKSLLLIPQRFAIEMVNRGWILRNTIIWHKPNCMPSSAKDRFTVDFEYVYFFVKSKRYFFEQQFEEYAPDTLPRMDRGVNINKWTLGADGQTPHNLSQPRLNKKRGYKTKQQNKEIHRPQHHGKDINYGKQGRNKRAVWAIPTKSFPEAHFAIYPETLIEPMIKAGCPEFVCKKCGKARVKIYKIIGKQITENMKVAGCDKEGKYKGTEKKDYDLALAQRPSETKKRILESMSQMKESYYTNCGCNAGFESGIVLDQFMGAGTTALVALKQRKRFIGIEIKQEYIDMAYKRIARVQQGIF